MTHPADLTQDDIAGLADTFRLLGDPTRLRILLFCLETPRSVSEITDVLSLSQSLVSHHLRLLRGARLVRGERRQKHVFYIATDDHVRGMLTDMSHHLNEP